jgi:hypothetical protein
MLPAFFQREEHDVDFDLNQNIRSLAGIDDSVLRASLLKSGWLPQFPAFADEDGVLIVGHRRMKLATELEITPVIETITFGDGSDGAAKRLELAIASNIGAAGLTKKDRQSIATLAYKHGYTMDQIGKMLNVDKATISRDIDKSELLHDATIKPSKTETNPKGAGRPKGSGKKAKATKEETKPVTKKIAAPAPTKVKDEKGRVAGVDIKVDPDVWREFNDRAREDGMSATAKIAELVTNQVQPPIDPSTLSISAQEKLAIAVKQATRKLEVEIEHRVRAEVTKWLNDDLLPMYRKNEALYKLMIEKRNGAMTNAEYKLIWSCLHSDSRKSVSDEKLNKAFNLFTKLEKLILNEKESPTQKSNLPSSSELMKRKAEYDAKRAADRTSKKSKGSTSNGVERR